MVEEQKQYSLNELFADIGGSLGSTNRRSLILSFLGLILGLSAVKILQMWFSFVSR